ncbi:hypothetical protein GGTG_09278 [Gaeumannomyces tritici R3-111a-1]|uniref:Uncharacterized protein n=1 Tax=Gaeumannomyces tritici (strain R3-111a-1) TaxID=644352 RepID=J3P6Y2_GAET3|nr:hypothetical protein GGTG_09278 [Gaeumannomyces tritici R3-111a-1]EJT72412.1 hypothetical protein GGTG_09278 [Gaeumannomyces tritici R3-111a-1]
MLIQKRVPEVAGNGDGDDGKRKGARVVDVEMKREVLDLIHDGDDEEESGKDANLPRCLDGGGDI